MNVGTCVVDVVVVGAGVVVAVNEGNNESVILSVD